MTPDLFFIHFIFYIYYMLCILLSQLYPEYHSFLSLLIFNLIFIYGFIPNHSQARQDRALRYTLGGLPMMGFELITFRLLEQTLNH